MGGLKSQFQRATMTSWPSREGSPLPDRVLSGGGRPLGVPAGHVGAAVPRNRRRTPTEAAEVAGEHPGTLEEDLGDGRPLRAGRMDVTAAFYRSSDWIDW